MTTTSHQPDTGGHTEAGGPAGRREDRSRLLVVAMVAVVAVLVVAAVAWAFLAGPLSSSARTEREIEQVLRDMGSSESLADFNSRLCEEQRMPQEMLDAIAGSGASTGVDLDAMFRERIIGSFPEELSVTGVEVDGDDAVATVESAGEGSEGAGPEELRLRHENGAWTVCETGVGMGALPTGQQPG